MQLLKQRRKLTPLKRNIIKELIHSHGNYIVPQVLRVEIDPSMMSEGHEVIEDLLAAAVNDGIRRAQQAAQESMASVTAGINLPDGFKMPF